MARDFVKARRVGDSMVVTLTASILAALSLEEGDRLLLETDGKGRLVMSKEEGMPEVTTKELELEIEILQKRKFAKEKERARAVTHHNRGGHPDFDDDGVMELVMADLNLEIAELDAELAEKRLELFRLGRVG